jgi:hypothetical protein
VKEGIMGFLGLSWYLWGVIGLVVAGIFFYIAPREQGAMSRRKYIIVRWFHGLVWVLLAVSFLLRGTGNSVAISAADIAAISSGIVYLVYLVTTFRG